jgi:hypothetical protein
LGSSQFKTSQEEIASLTKMILESKTPDKTSKQVSRLREAPEPDPEPEPFPEPRIKSSYSSSSSEPNEDNIDYNLMKVISHPKFDEIVKNYALIHHPEWLLNRNIPRKSYKETFGNMSSFGNQYQSTFCSNIKNYIIFYIVSIMIFISLTLYFK